MVGGRDQPDAERPINELIVFNKNDPRMAKLPELLKQIADLS